MQQMVYWQAPLWQLLLALVGIMVVGAWLLRERVRHPVPSPLFPIGPGNDQPIFFYDFAGEAVGLNETAKLLLEQSEGEVALTILRDVLGEALAEERVVQQIHWPEEGTSLLVIPILDEENSVRGVMGLVTVETVALAINEGTSGEANEAEGADAVSVWEPIGRQLQYHHTRARVRVKRQGKWEENELSYNEQQLLQFLVAHVGDPQTAETLFACVWQDEARGYALQPSHRDRLRRLVYQLRRHIEPTPSDPTYLVTVHGIGYVFHSQPPA